MVIKEKILFLTGATGFIGRHFMEDASRAGYRFYILTRNRKLADLEKVPGCIEILVGDLTEINRFRVQISQCTHFIHLAGEKSRQEDMFKVNVTALQIILDELKNFPEIRFLHLSSCGVYGIYNHKDVLINEESECIPSDLYERTKLDAEEVIAGHSRRYSLNYVILRPSNVFGEMDKSLKLLTLMKSLKRGFFFYTDSQSMVNYVYVKYLTFSMIRFIEMDLFNKEIYNVNSPVGLLRFVELIKIKMNVNKRVWHLPGIFMYILVFIFEMFPRKMRLLSKSKYNSLNNRKVYSTDKLQQVLNDNGQKWLDEGIGRLIDYYRNKKLL